MTIIVEMTAADIPFALQMTGHEGWGMIRHDFLGLLEYSPHGCFIAREDDRPVGIISSVKYGDFAFLGTLIVAPDCRGRKIGETLMRRAIGYLHGVGVTTIELDGVFAAVNLYRRLGFADKYLSLRFRRLPDNLPGPAEDRKPAKSLIKRNLLNLDSILVPYKRSFLLSSYYDAFSSSLIAIDKAPCPGYAFMRPLPGNAGFIGPFAAKSAKVAKTILGEIIDRYGQMTLVAGIPDINRAGVRLFRSNGFFHTLPSLRMYLGRRIDYEKAVFGIAAPHLG